MVEYFFFKSYKKFRDTTDVRYVKTEIHADEAAGNS